MELKDVDNMIKKLETQKQNIKSCKESTENIRIEKVEQLQSQISVNSQKLDQMRVKLKLLEDQNEEAVREQIEFDRKINKISTQLELEESYAKKKYFVPQVGVQIRIYSMSEVFDLAANSQTSLLKIESKLKDMIRRIEHKIAQVLSTGEERYQMATEEINYLTMQNTNIIQEFFQKEIELKAEI